MSDSGGSDRPPDRSGGKGRQEKEKGGMESGGKSQTTNSNIGESGSGSVQNPSQQVKGKHSDGGGIDTTSKSDGFGARPTETDPSKKNKSNTRHMDTEQAGQTGKIGGRFIKERVEDFTSDLTEEKTGVHHTEKPVKQKTVESDETESDQNKYGTRAKAALKKQDPCLPEAKIGRGTHGSQDVKVGTNCDDDFHGQQRSDKSISKQNGSDGQEAQNSLVSVIDRETRKGGHDMNESFCVVDPEGNVEISVYVKTLTGKVITINAKLTDTIGKVREKIKDEEGIAVDAQRLIFEGKQLEENHTLLEYNIGKGSTIHLVVSCKTDRNRDKVDKDRGMSDSSTRALDVSKSHLQEKTENLNEKEKVNEDIVEQRASSKSPTVKSEFMRKHQDHRNDTVDNAAASTQKLGKSNEHKAYDKDKDDLEDEREHKKENMQPIDHASVTPKEDFQKTAEDKGGTKHDDSAGQEDNTVDSETSGKQKVEAAPADTSANKVEPSDESIEKDDDTPKPFNNNFSEVEEQTEEQIGDPMTEEEQRQQEYNNRQPLKTSKVVKTDECKHTGKAPVAAPRKKNQEWSFKSEGSMTVKPGELLLLEVIFEGQEPNVSCLFNGAEHPDDSRASIQIKDSKIIFQLENVVPSDEGKYTLTAENKTGSGAVSTTLYVLDKPSTPKSLTISNITSESCHLHWQKPDHENGSRISKYIVQMCENSEKDWIEAGSSTTTDKVVNKLQRKTQYRLRVAAENEVGTGEFLEMAAPITTEDISGESQQTDNDTHPESGSPLSSSFERLSDEDQGETNFDEKNVSLQFQMSSMTHMVDDDLKELENNKETSSVKDKKTDTEIANGKEKHNTYSVEDKEENKKDTEGFCNKESQKSIPQKSPKYTLKPVGKNYMLHSQIHEPVKVSQITGELNVSVEDNYILIDGEIVYSINYESGKIMISKVEEAKFDVKQGNQECCPSPITNDHHNEEIPSKSEGKTANAVKVRTTKPVMETLMKVHNDEKSQTLNCSSPIADAGADKGLKFKKQENLDSDIEKLTDGIKELGIEDTKENHESAPRPPDSGQPTSTSRQAMTDEADSPTPPPRKKALGNKDGQLSIPVRVYVGNENKRLDAVCNTVSEYLKWMFLIQNKEAAKLLSSSEINVENGEIAIRCRHTLEGKQIDDAVKNCLRASMNDILGLYIASLEVNGNGRDALDVIEQSKIVKEHNLYIYMGKSSQRIHFVCFENMIDHVDEEFRLALEKLKSELKSRFCIEAVCQDECKIIFDHCNVQDTIAEKYNGVRFGYTSDYKKRSCTFCLSGQSLVELEKAKELVHAEIMKHTYLSFPFSEIKNMKGLNTEFAVDYLQREISDYCKMVSNDDLHFKVDINVKRVFIAGFKQGNVDSVAGKVKSCISYKDFHLESMDENSKSNLLDFQSDNKDKVFIDISGDICKCFGSAQVLKTIESRLANSGAERRKREKQADDHARTKVKCVYLKDFNTFEFIKNITLVKSLEQGLDVTVEPGTTGDKFGFVIRGIEDKQMKACEDLIKSIDCKVKEKEICVTMPSSQKSKYDASLLEIEKECKVLIKAMEQTTVSNQHTGTSRKKRWVFGKGHSLILSHGAAENSFEDLIVDVKKFENEKECKPLLKTVDADRKRTQLYVPIYQEIEEAGKQYHIFIDSMDAILKQSASYDCVHICIPMDERFGWPFHKFVKKVLFSILKHLNETARPLPLPVEVELCMKDFSEFVEGCKITATAIPYVEEIGSKDVCERITHQSNQIDIRIEEGKLDEKETDVIVNTTDSNLNLQIGAVSKSLFNKAGDGIQIECTQKYPAGIKDGKIAITRGYKLRCRHVLHGSLEFYNLQMKRDLLQKIKKFVKDCLEIANFLGHRRIAFPVIGAGKLGYPEDQVADILLDAVQEFKKKPGVINKLQEVTVVIFDNKDLVKMFKKKVKEQDKRKGKASGNAGVTTSSHVKYAGVMADVEVATLDACRKADALLVFWDCNSLPGVSSKKHFVLEGMGKEASKEFFDQRNTMRTKLKPLSTNGGQLQNHIVIHVPVKDHPQSLKKSFKMGILQADKEMSYSLALYFNAKDSPFLIYSEQLAKEFLEAFKELSAYLQNLCHVSLVFEGVLQPEKYFQVFEKDEMAIREDTEEQRRSIVKVVGYEDSIKKAEERLNVLKEKVKSSVLHGAEAAAIRAPEMPSMDRRYELPPGEEIPLGDKKDVLKKWDNTIGYVKVSHIPENSTYNGLCEDIMSLDLPGDGKRLIYLDGMSEAVLVCKTSEDALQLCRYKDAAPFVFSNMEKKGVGNLRGNVALTDLTKLKQQGRYDRFKEGVLKLSATFDERDVYNIKAPTSFQLVCVHKLVERLLEEDNTFGDFVLIKPTATIEDVTDKLWEILQVEKESTVEEFKKSGGTITHSGEVLTVSGDEQQQNNMFNDFVNVFKSFAKEMKGMEFGEVPVDDEYIDNITKWKDEIEKTLGKRCCTFIPKQKKIIAYCDAYEEAKQIEHHFLVKQGKRKQTGRRRKGAATEGSGPSSLQPVYDIQPEVKVDGFEWSKDAKNIKAFKTSEGIQIYVYEANILKLPVDCIVNAANDTLQHGGGVAEVIAKKAGHRLTEEGFRYIKRYGKIPVGEAVPTTAGNLHYRCVIHAVGPRWSDYKRSYENVCRCEQDLFNAILNSCLRAVEEGCQSIAFPAISSAIFGVPGDLCVCQYVKATIEFSRRNLQSLKEIHFIDRKPEIIRQIQAEFKTVLEENKESPYQRQTYIRQTRGYRNTSNGSKGNSEFGQNSSQFNNSGCWKQSWKRSISTQSNVPQTVNMHSGKLRFYTTDGGAHVYLLGGDENHTLHVYKGDLFNVQSAAVVVTVDENRQGGALSNKVASKMREANVYELYRRSLEKNLPSKSKVGQIAITKGFGTDFSHVFHVVFPINERKKPEAERRKCMVEIYHNILSAGAKEKDVNIIATTLIGIDNSREDVDLACNAFLDGYQCFLKDKKSARNSHSEVHLVWRHETNFGRICSTFDSFAEGQLKQQQAADKTMVGQASGNQYPENADLETNESERSEDCVICMDQMTNPKPLNCGHRFCTECIDKYFEIKKTCPTCGAVCGVITGDQPGGYMTVNFDKMRHCAGYPHCGQISITYNFPSGRQGPNHPNPGTWYKGITRTAYLPDSTEGVKVLEMLKVAFDRKLVFTIGSSRTTGQEGVITWNDIHHKTDPKPYSQFGYPDPTYLTRVKDELAAKGVTEDDIPKIHAK